MGGFLIAVLWVAGVIFLLWLITYVGGLQKEHDEAKRIRENQRREEEYQKELRERRIRRMENQSKDS